MESGSLDDTRFPDKNEPREGDETFPGLDIEIDERVGTIRVYDPRLFQAGRRGFCEQLLKAASRQPGIRRADVDLASASCGVEFGPGSNTPEFMADAFVHAVREVSASPARDDRTPWWGRPRGWSALTAFRLPGGVSLWETFEVEPGRLRLRRRGLTGGRARLSRLADTLADLEGVEACHVSPWFRRITIDYRADSPLSDRLLDRVEHALRGLEAAELPRLEHPTDAPSPDADGSVEVAAGWKRPMHLALAGGAFAMTLVGLAVPGIPTVPCLLATSYYLARSSPRLNERLRRTAFFGPILQEWEHHGGLSRSSKGKLTGLTLAIVIVTVVLAPLSPVTLILIILISSLSIYGIARTPALPDEPRAGAPLNGQARLSLPSP